MSARVRPFATGQSPLPTLPLAPDHATSGLTAVSTQPSDIASDRRHNRNVALVTYEKRTRGYRYGHPDLALLEEESQSSVEQSSRHA